MIRTIMAFFGYTKIPVEAIMLSMAQERFLTHCLNHETSPVGKEYFQEYLENQKALTDFLRSGKIL